MSTPKFNPSSPLAPLHLATNCNNNILQPKRLNNNNNININTGSSSDSTSVLSRRVLGQKGQLPSPLSLNSNHNNTNNNNGISHLSNQQLTTFLRNSPIIDHHCNSNTTSSGNGIGLSNLDGECVNVLPPSKRAPTTMAKRNARERNRVKQVNQGFQTLRHHIPDSYRMKKMSKVDTLRCALDYIRNLERILQLPEEDCTNLLSPNQSSATSISPSTSSLIFSSEEDELFVQSPYHSHQQHKINNQNVLSVNTIVDKICKNNSNKEDSEEMDHDDPFGSTHRIILPSSSYNDENNDESNLENLKLGIKVETCTSDDETELSFTAKGDNNYRIGVIGIGVSVSTSDGIDMGRDANADKNVSGDLIDVVTGDDLEMGNMTAMVALRNGQSQGHHHQALSDGHSDIENYHEENSSDFLYC